MAKRNFIGVRLDPETSRKLDYIVEHSDANISKLVRLAIVNKYSELTDTIRVPLVGRVEGERVSFGTDTKYE